MQEFTHFFRYNGRDSTEFGIRIFNNVHLPVPEREIEFVDVPGRNGSLSLDKGRYQDIVFEMPCEVRTTGGMKLDVLARHIMAWLCTGRWEELYFSGHPDYYYTALVHEAFEIEDFTRRRGRMTIPFRLKPTKRRLDGDLPLALAQGDVLYNPEPLSAYPLIFLRGSGDVTLRLGDDLLIIRDLNGTAAIDCASCQAYDGEKNLSSLVYSYPFPVLRPGRSEVSWSGNLQSVQIAPRWEAFA